MVSELTLLFQIYQTYLDKSTPFTAYRWLGTGSLLVIFFLRIFIEQGWYIGSSHTYSDINLAASLLSI